LKFYHPDLYEISAKGWYVMTPNELKNSFKIFE
jgi:hypothetical protein